MFPILAILPRISVHTPVHRRPRRRRRSVSHASRPVGTALTQTVSASLGPGVLPT